MLCLNSPIFFTFSLSHHFSFSTSSMTCDEFDTALPYLAHSSWNCNFFVQRKLITFSWIFWLWVWNMTIIREQIIWTLIELWSLGLPRESMPYLENVASLMLEIFPQPKCRIIIVIYKTGELRFVLETASLKHYRTLTASLGIHSEHSHHLKRNNNTEIFIYWSIIIFDRCKLIQVISRCIL